VNRGEIERQAHYKYGINPKTPYAIGKAAAEDLIVQYWGKQCGGEYVITRLFNVYGPRQPLAGKYATVVGLFEKQLLEGKHCTIVGDGLQQRDFTHVSDVAQVLAWLGGSAYKVAYMDHAHNLASGVSVDMIGLVRLLAKHHGLSTYGFTHVPERKGESRTVLAKGYCATIRSIHEVLVAKQTG
jgi:UDP-glucose 4-epimerase